MKNKKNHLKFLGIIAGSALSIGLLSNISDAASFVPLDVIGKGPITVTYDNDDTKGITNYAGVDKFRVCIDCQSQLDSKPSTETWKAATNGANAVVTRINKGNLFINNYDIPNKTSDGKHYLCVQTMDDTEKTINSKYQIGNISAAKCYRFYYYIKQPKMTNIIVNNNNRYTNKSDIPIKMDFVDNYAGIRSVKYDDGRGNIKTVPASDIKCKRNTTPGSTEGSWSCTMDTIININSDRSDADITFLIEDMVGNSAWTSPRNIRFDKILPTGSVEIHNDGDGVVNSNIGYVEYHVKDPAETPWIYPSGLIKVTVSEMDGSHNVVLLDDPDLTKEKQTTLDGMLDDYLLTTCDTGPVKVKLFVADRAGNYTGDGKHNDVIVSNEVICSKAKITRFDVTDVVNPGKYTESKPFETMSWNFNDSDTIPEGMENDILAPLLAGSNATFEFDVEWTGDINAKATAVYSIYVKNTEQKYERTFNGSLEGSSFKLSGNGKKYATFKDTITMPKDAPASIDRNKTTVSINATVTITSIEGGKNKVTKSSATFDKHNNEAVWGEITGSIDDYLWFGETN